MCHLASCRSTIRQETGLPLLNYSQHHHPRDRTALHHLWHIHRESHLAWLLWRACRVPLRNLRRRRLVRPRASKVPCLVRLVSRAHRQASPHAIRLHQLWHELEVDTVVVRHLECDCFCLLLLPHGRDQLRPETRQPASAGDADTNGSPCGFARREK